MEGYRFAGWKIKVNGTYLPPIGGDPAVYSRVPDITLSITGTIDVEALFEPLSAIETPFQMHVWNFENTSSPLFSYQICSMSASYAGSKTAWAANSGCMVRPTVEKSTIPIS